LAKDVDLEEIARRTEGYSGADLELLVREATFLALRENIDTKEVSMRHFEEALRKVRPSVTPDMLKFYESWLERARQLTTPTKAKATPPLYL